MRILFTGVSSFTGYWFVNELHRSGHEVHATLQNSIKQYEGLRQRRLERLKGKCLFHENISFGNQTFLELIENENFDVLCHHGADVTDYRSQSFDVVRALENNTKSVAQITKMLSEGSCQSIIITGSVFESDEGVGLPPIQAFSPYGLSKSLTSSVFKYWADHFGLTLGKFIIPNPFGPFEEDRFTTYLAKTWLNNQVASVRTPDYIRDNIHVKLLAQLYADFIIECCEQRGFLKMAPTGYAGSQGSFTQRLSNEMQPRLSCPCDFNLQNQTDFPEPLIRVNSDQPHYNQLQWDEQQSWDELAEYYLDFYRD